MWLRDEFNNTMALPARATIVVDVNPPSNASVVIAGGAPVILDNRNVSVDFGAWDYSGVAQMCYDQGGSDGSACQGSWGAFRPTVNITFAAGQVRSAKQAVPHRPHCSAFILAPPRLQALRWFVAQHAGCAVLCCAVLRCHQQQWHGRLRALPNTCARTRL